MCNCNNNRVISSTAVNGGLPTGCTAIQDITSVDQDTQTLVTITLCDGTIRQFIIPHGAPGDSGTNGENGANGEDAPTIQNIETTQLGDTVTLVFTLSDGSSYTQTFIVPGLENNSRSAYVVDVVGINTQSVELTTSEHVIAASTVPGSTFQTVGDTLEYTIAINIEEGARVPVNQFTSIFKLLQLGFGGEGLFVDATELALDFSVPNVTSATKQFTIKGSITYLGVKENGTIFSHLAEMIFTAEANTTALSHTTGSQVPAVLKHIQSFRFSQNLPDSIDSPLYIQLVADGADTIANYDFTAKVGFLITKLIPKI